ncbi:hypothetical protein KJ671_00150 [Patescibacteria group bacterium]|nr:hypothetical protein [Patescibacteria group bacterium]
MSKKIIFILMSVILLSFFIIAINTYLQQKESRIIGDEPIIGGERDEHGCLGPAGYRWSDEVNACIRDWELDDNQIKASKIAVDYVGYEKALTIIQVLTARCPGCFMVELEKEKDRIKITLENYEVVKKSLTPDECIAEGGETVNTTGGATCSENQLNIGEVAGFISPNVCCVPD